MSSYSNTALADFNYNNKNIVQFSNNKETKRIVQIYDSRFGFYGVFYVTFNNISAISWRSVLLVEATGVPGENHRPVASHWQWQTLSHNVYHKMCTVCPSSQNWLKVIKFSWKYLNLSKNMICNVIQLYFSFANKFTNKMPRMYRGGGKGYDVTHNFQQYFSYFVAVSFIGGGNRSTHRKPPNCCKSTTNFIT